ncbi:MAG: hypothetical protein JWQ54_3788 [Mucilaginibacter sp.]|nr:hypothetical protein [Mucilaginibacter sp.]
MTIFSLTEGVRNVNTNLCLRSTLIIPEKFMEDLIYEIILRINLIVTYGSVLLNPRSLFAKITLAW